MTYNRPKLGAAVFVIKNGKFLLGKRKSKLSGGTWCVPGGHIEFGESFESCVKRESLEEAGVKIKNVRFLGVTNDIFDGKHYVTITMVSDYNFGIPHVTEFDEFYEWGWYTLDNLPTPLFYPFENLLASHEVLIAKHLGSQK